MGVCVCVTKLNLKDIKFLMVEKDTFWRRALSYCSYKRVFVSCKNVVRF